MPARNRGTTSQRGLGYKHQKERAGLLRAHVDGAPCAECGRPMYREPSSNWDGKPLHADHGSLARAHGGRKADRLLHGTCNERRGDGMRQTSPVPARVLKTSREW